MDKAQIDEQINLLRQSSEVYHLIGWLQVLRFKKYGEFLPYPDGKLRTFTIPEGDLHGEFDSHDQFFETYPIKEDIQRGQIVRSWNV